MPGGSARDSNRHSRQAPLAHPITAVILSFLQAHALRALARSQGTIPPPYFRGSIVISIHEEQLLTFGQAANWLPPTRRGNSLHPNTIWRWAKRGLKATDGRIVRLDTIKVGGTNCTSVEAMQRFFDELHGGEPIRKPRTSKNRQAKAAAELDKLGI